jgi:protein transport protein SEC24
MQPMQQPFQSGQPMQPPGGYGQQAPPPVNAGGAMSSPFGATPAGNVRASPFAGGGGASAPPSAPPTQAFGSAAGGAYMPPPPSMADMAAKKMDPPPMGLAPPPMSSPTPGMQQASQPAAAFQAAAAMGGAAAYQGVPGMGGAAAQPGHQARDPHLEAFLSELDGMNSPKSFVRASVSKFPNSVSSKMKTNLPLGILLQPLAPSVPVPDVNPGGSGGILRCKQCRTYMNPFVKWESNGSRWVCNLCGFSQVTPNEYYSHLEGNGLRSDRYERHELCKGAVEYVAPGEYMVRPPQPPVYMFVIDVSYAAVSTGMLHSVVDAIKHAIQNQLMPGGQRIQVGIITYDTSLHFYNLNANLAQPQMLVVADLEDLFLPLPDDILVNAYESESAIMSLLDSLPSMFQDTKVSENCMGSAVKGAFLAMKHIGGKLLLFNSCIPSIGENALKSTRDQPRLYGTEREVELLRPVSENFKDMANELTRAQISVELFIGAQTYVDLASLAPLAKFTGGDLRYYQGFHIQTHGMKLKSELVHVLSRYMGWEAVMRVRVSRGWKITGFYGHLFVRGQDLLVVPNCHTDQTFAITVDMEENVTPDPVMFVQSALLYTNSEGERRIRVHTWAAPTTQNHSDILNSVDVQACAKLLSHTILESSLKLNLAEGRNRLNTQCQQIVQSMAASESLQFMPLYIMGMLKSAAFRGSNDIGADLRTSIWSRLESLSVSQASAFFYPRLIGLHNLPDHCGVPDENGQVTLPDMLSLSKDCMTQEGVYLLEDGDAITIWIGRAADPSFLNAVFGNANIDELDINAAELYVGTAGDPLSNKISFILGQIRAERSVPYMQVGITKGGGDQKELKFFSSLIEDRTHALQTTYMEFLGRMGYRAPQQAAQAPPAMRR